MSWTLGTMVATADELGEVDDAGLPQVGYGEAESDAAIREAKKAIRALVRSGALGEGPFHVTANGHSNPQGQQGSDGPTFLTITLTSEANLQEDLRTPTAQAHAAAALQADGAGELPEE